MNQNQTWAKDLWLLDPADPTKRFRKYQVNLANRKTLEITRKSVKKNKNTRQHKIKHEHDFLLLYVIRLQETPSLIKASMTKKQISNKKPNLSN